jgi:selenocysteine lyase/cysteine desulfurase
MAALRESDEMELRIGRVGPDRAADLALREQEARAGLAAVLAAPLERLVLSHAAADLAAAITRAWLARPSPGSRAVVVVEGVAAAVQQAVGVSTRQLGAEVRLVPAPPRILSPDVSVVVMAHVDRTGERLDPAPVRAAAQRVGARLLLDASLSVGAAEIRVAEVGADALVADVRHWLLGPDGVALAWVAGADEEPMPAGVAAPEGSFGRAALLATARSAGWLLMFVGLPWMVSRTSMLGARLRESLARIPGVDMLTPADGHVALLALRIAGWDAVAAAEELSHSIFAITDPEPEGDVLRVSVGAWNTEAELERFAARVGELAASTPETLRRRPALTIISAPQTGADE